MVILALGSIFWDNNDTQCLGGVVRLHNPYIFYGSLTKR